MTDFLLIAILTLLNGAFAMSEMALSAARRLRLVALQEAGDRGAGQAVALMDSPTRFLSTVQIGITSIGMLNGIVGEAAFSDGLAQWLVGFGLRDKWANWGATGIVVSTITFTTIIFGELVPKRIGQMYPEQVARAVAIPMTWLAAAAKPFVWLLTSVTQAMLKLLRIDPNASRDVTEEEINASLKEGVDAGVIEAQEHQMVRNVFHLDDRSITGIMVPRQAVLWLDAGLTVSQALERMRAEPQAANLNWYLICNHSLDEVLGAVHLRQLLLSEAQTPLRDLAQKVPFAPETLNGLALLSQFRQQALQIVCVVDEYGVVQGTVTQRDLLEAITGEISSERKEDNWVQQQPDGSWLLDGAMPAAEFVQRFAPKRLDALAQARYSTVAGLFMHEAGELPALGRAVAIDEWQLTVARLEGRRVAQLTLKAAD